MLSSRDFSRAYALRKFFDTTTNITPKSLHGSSIPDMLASFILITRKSNSPAFATIFHPTF